MRDDITEMVFINDNEIVARFRYPKSRGDFGQFPTSQFCHDRENAIFSVEADGPWGLTIVPVPHS